ncbi:PREDICTED: protein NRT1/ PTR FAMILY 1.2-like [Ipomoea nil]|uniref:protein NRT1/ PTR FAMILY 1.2-like n=1 Tax=Ipomoea nil TaxID=35883 RepID=UPI0009017ED8|nr:PREDICTED: protein NRT1/ PTR FAMILY 1.2-like [Ipomoea nil]
MENYSDEKENMPEEQKPLLPTSVSSKGGIKTLPFIIGSYGLMNMVPIALSANMIVYLMKEYHMDMASGTNFIYIWSALSNFAPVIGAFMADSFVGRFQMIGIGCFFSLVGTLLVWLSTMILQVRPPWCSESSESCSPPTASQFAFLCIGLSVFAVGSGGVASSTLAFGADQLNEFENKGNTLMESYVSMYCAMTSFSMFVGITGLIYIQENFGWKVGYGVLVAIVLFGALVFFLGSAWYVRPIAKKNLITGLFQVMVASCRNRHLQSSLENYAYYSNKASILSHPSEKLRFLNKACIIQDPQRDLATDGTAINPWRLCTVDQVEELKALLKVMPIWLTRMIMSINLTQASFVVLQATTLDRHIGPNFEIPAASIGSLGVVFVVVWVVSYDRIVLPLASRISGKPFYFNMKSRMGCGIFVSFLSMAAMAAVEGIRRREAIEEGYSDDPEAGVPMSILWVLPTYALTGIAEGMNGVALNEFYISEFPKSMSSIASSLYVLSMAFANLLSSFIMSVINRLTARDGEESWISSNINKGHYDYFYWVLSGLSMANFLLFLVFSKAYGPFKDQTREAQAMEEEDIKF